MKSVGLVWIFPHLAITAALVQKNPVPFID
jgi:hypothetical protein